jgi:conjugative transposon TraM protein
MKKLNLKQPKYIFPLVILLPIVFLAYEISKFTDSSDEPQKGVVTDNINMSLPDARNEGVGSKLDEMNKHFSEDGAYTAIGALGDDKEAADSTMSGYSESELNDIDAENAKRMRKQKEQEDLERSLAEARKHINSYGFDDGGSYGSRSGHGIASRGGRQSDMEDYARELEEIQQRSLERQKVLERTFGGADEEKERKAEEERKRLAEERKKKEVKPELVMKAEDKNAGMFNTINEQQEADAPLIKAMIDKTTKAHEGTRLRFKLLDDVIIKDVRLKKGTYLYGIVTGFGQQRVMASISSILVGDKFIKVSLSVFDNDGMEGFYVPESAFRDMMKDAGAQAMQSNISFDGGYGGGLSGEAVALQALQNMYQSASTAISGNIRKNKARIKYNTIVYLINKDAINQ